MGHALALPAFFRPYSHYTQRLSLKQGRIMHQERFVRLTLQRHFRVLTKFAHVESRLSGRKRQKEVVFYTPVILCDRRPCSTSVAVGLARQRQELPAEAVPGMSRVAVLGPID